MGLICYDRPMEIDGSARRLLAGIHIFAGLSDQAMESLAASCQHLHVESGQAIVEQGAVASEMFVIVRGKVEVIKHAGSPAAVLLENMEAGEFFGEMCILECMPRAATVRALEPTDLYVLSNGDLLKLFRKCPDQYAILVLNISRDLCRRLRRVHELLCTARSEQGEIRHVKGDRLE